MRSHNLSCHKAHRPAMIQAEAAEKSMFARRAIFAVLFLVTMAGSLWLAVLALMPGGFGILDLAALVLFAVILPWMVAGFSNAVIGFIIMRFSADPVAAVLPAASLIGDDQPVTASTAILLCVRNELPLRIIRNLEPMLEGIHASGYGERFHLYLLSDTNDAHLAVRHAARHALLHDRKRVVAVRLRPLLGTQRCPAA